MTSLGGFENMLRSGKILSPPNEDYPTSEAPHGADVDDGSSPSNNYNVTTETGVTTDQSETHLR